MNVCAVEACDRRSYSRGLCRRHYEAEPDIKARSRAYDLERHQRRKDTPVYRATVQRAKKRFYATPRGRDMKAGENRRARERRGPDRARNYNLNYLYGITLDEWREMFAAQGERCAICQSDEHNGRGWHVDHDHSCCPGGKSCGACIRGILCSKCNSGLGLFGDDPERLRAATAYLTSS